MEQTAVEWLVEQLTAIGQLEIPKGSNVVTEIIRHAKEIEKIKNVKYYYEGKEHGFLEILQRNL